MKLTRLRIAGFKSFVDPVEIPIEPGLTGVVGPNGCGKSNLVEALRWVMGESSGKSLRGSGMEDVIFSGSAGSPGSAGRPGRNMAEVGLAVDNAKRTAPAAFNDANSLDVTRKIVRDEGSTYRINGREVRLRDVQLLFADAATGPRSPALVRQGQIAELIAAKPQARRRILEDAAGIAGLHARRHEAELRLKAADDNLLRVEDVLREIEAQLDGLRRQGRQAARYRALSAEIRRLDALLHAAAFAEARAAATDAEQAAGADGQAVAERAAEQAKAATAQAVAAHALPALRDAEVAAAAALQRLLHARSALEAEERRATERLAELERQGADAERDFARTAAERADAKATIARLEAESAELARRSEGAGGFREAAESAARKAEAELSGVEAEVNRLLTEHADAGARRAALERTGREENERARRLAAERAAASRDLGQLPDATAAADLEALRIAAETAARAAAEAEEEAGRVRAAVASAREAEARGRAPLAQAERAAQRLETEARTLAKLFAPAAGDRWPRALDALTVAKGFETALGAALGDDLDASTDAAAPSHWAETEGGADDPALPEGVRPLAAFVEAPPALRRRLGQIGVVEEGDGPRLRGQLKPGQRLVTRSGDLWRWDGFVQAAEAPSAAARRLAERNRLGDLAREAIAARGEADRLTAEAEAAGADARAAASAEARALGAATVARKTLDAARERLGAAERRETGVASRRAALGEAVQRIAAAEAEARERATASAAALAALPPALAGEAALQRARNRAAAARAAALDARATLHNLVRDAEARERRRAEIAGDLRSWRDRAARSDAASSDLRARLDRVRTEADRLREAPNAFAARRRALRSEVEAAEARRRATADALAGGETALAAADRAARLALDALGRAREARAGSQARAEAATERVAALTRSIAESFDTTPSDLADLAGLKPGAHQPPVPETEARLASLKDDRERLGAVNLRAEEEGIELGAKRDGIARERDDLVEAIKRLRGAIGGLNREGRERLLAAFGAVNGHFGRLFATLFGGGEAQLTLVDSDDPLEAGLEILARPPGKKTQTLTLLSGGEQALTATALIFAVFLTNPSPICVLDEVDAPLDDANVERFCDLLAGMARDTDTRFLVITHNPITMARMDRLIGVTMAERGVSQIVSVDLGGAERLLETG